MAAKTLEDLFLDTLKDVYYAERKILKTLPTMERAATASELKQAFKAHRQETEGQVARLEQVFEILGKRAQGKTCAAIDGITDAIHQRFTGRIGADNVAAARAAYQHVQEQKEHSDA